MIKQLEFVSRRSDHSADGFETLWRSALALFAAAPVSARPLRITAGTVMHDINGTDARHDGVALMWFTDDAHLARFDAWSATADGRGARAAIDEVVDTERTATVVADESVGRGAEWLERRWSDGGEKLKHMAIAFRARGLTQQEFSELWRSRAGTVKQAGATSAATIPDLVRGLAYVQNHPRPRPGGEWAYDAVNEVYFDDFAGLSARIDYFAEMLRDRTEEDLVSENWFLAVREVPVAAADQ